MRQRERLRAGTRWASRRGLRRTLWLLGALLVSTSHPGWCPALVPNSTSIHGDGPRLPAGVQAPRSTPATQEEVPDHPGFPQAPSAPARKRLPAPISPSEGQVVGPDSDVPATAPSTSLLPSQTLHAIPPPVVTVGGKARATRGLGYNEHEAEPASYVPSRMMRLFRAFGLYLVAVIVGVWMLYRQFRRSVKPRKAAPRF